MKITVVLGILLLFEQVHAESLQIHVRNEAQIAKGNVELGAIATITSTDQSDDGAIAGLILGESPQVGKTAEWSAAEISKRLRPYSRILQDARMFIPDRVVIRRVATPVARDLLKVQIEEMLRATLPDPSWEAQLISVSLPKQLEVFRPWPHDGSVQVVPFSSRPRGAANFEVQVVQDGKVVNRVWVSGRVAYFATVPVLKRTVQNGSRVLESDLSWVKKDVTFLMDIPATPADMKNAVLRMPLRPETVILRSQLEREVATRFGEEVEIMAGDESFSVTSKGQSQQNGFIGDLIKVKPAAGGKILSGILVARGVVQLRY